MRMLANFTGRPSAWVALLAMSAWTRGRSTRYGTATSAAIASTTIAATPTRIHFTRDQAVWIADSFQGFGPTGRANVQYSEKSWAARLPSTSAPLASSTV